MIIQGRQQRKLHLTYCLNIHSGETWPEVFAAVRGKACRVRDAVAPGRPFGLGLRLSAQAAGVLVRPDALQSFRSFLADQGLYVFTINGFPYGAFHKQAVKENVYRPDWRDPARTRYTLTLAKILAALLPPDVDGSISTVPCSYGPWIRTPEDRAGLVRQLADAAAGLDRIHGETGRLVNLALEPEPDCFIETTEGAIAFFETILLPQGAPLVRECLGLAGEAEARAMLLRYIGICADTAHMAVAFEDPAASLARLQAAGIRISKIQLSAALHVDQPDDALMRQRLQAFAEPVYLHQVKALSAEGRITAFPDLPRALASEPASDRGPWRVHFHVPLFFTAHEGLASTSQLLDARFFDALRMGASDHLEIETYTFDVLPDALRSSEVADSIINEYRWILERLCPDDPGSP